jgi:transcriptional repressor NrdR
MRCPFCKEENDKVIDSRSANDGAATRRRRECEACGKRYTTYERVEEIPLYVIKKDHRREAFGRLKVLAGIRKACEKRPISLEVQEAMADSIERSIRERFDKEIPSTVIGELVMQQLAKTDQVAYVRFASVYRDFQDVGHFMKELKTLLVKK